MTNLLVLSMLLTLFLMVLSSKLKIKMFKESEKMSPFECGFDPNHKMRSSFSLRFFLITVLFLIFDVEMTVILPIPLSIWNNENWKIMINSSLVILILGGGTLIEWTQGALDWAWTYI